MNLVVGTYNLANLVGAAKTPRQLELLARNIERSGVQLLALQEVHGSQVLQNFLQDYLPGQFPGVALIPGNDRRGIEVAVVSRLPILEVVSHKELRVFRRDVLRVDVDVHGWQWSLFCVHLKSRRPGRGPGPTPQQERLAEAIELKRIVAAEAHDHPFVIAGDFNDEADSPALQTLLQAGLFSALEILPPRKRATYPGKNPQRQLDFILHPQAMQERLVSAKVWKEARCSDHCLVIAEYRVQP